MIEYELAIDLRANGPRRGLLVAVESIHPLHPAPPLRHHVTAVREVADVGDARARQRQVEVYAAVTRDWLSTKAIALRCGKGRRTVLQALRRLLTHRVIERQLPMRTTFVGKAQQEWRRTR